MSAPIEWVYDDGGRATAGFLGQTSDCVTRAVAIATGQDYRVTYDAINEQAQAEQPKLRAGRNRGRRSSARTGVFKATTRRYLADLGWTWTPTMQIGAGCTVHLRRDELPPGRVIVQLSKHVAAVIDGVLRDTHDSSRDGTRCVYGYWTAP
jgi:hypothetical protein